MNTVDAISDLGGKSSNFLDTGGKATSETVKSSFRIILKDPRVKTIFVNIFGGLTLCDMIANGIILAYKDLGIEVPVVVRLRGTNEEVGQRMVSEPQLPITKRADLLRLQRAGFHYMHLMTLMRLLRKLLNWPDEAINLCFTQILYIHFDPSCLISILTTDYERLIVSFKVSSLAFYNIKLKHFETVVSFAIRTASH